MGSKFKKDTPEIDAAIKVLRRSSWFAIVAVDMERTVTSSDGREVPATSRIVYHEDAVTLDALESFLRASTACLDEMVQQCVDHRAKLEAGDTALGPTPWHPVCAT